MSLTRTREPDRWSPVYNPIIYEFESSYLNYWIGLALTVSSITDENGFNKVNFFGVHGLEVGDVVEIVDDDGTEVAFGGVQIVTSVPSSTSIITDKAYTNGISNDTSVYKYARDYKCSLEVRGIVDSVDTSLGFIEQQPVLELVSGTTYRPVFTFDVAEVLKQYINNQEYDVHSLTVEGLETNENSYLKYYVKFAEEFSEGVSGATEFVTQAYTTDTDSSYGNNYRWSLNAAMQYDEQIGETYKLEQYLVDGVRVAKWLTDRPECSTKLKTDTAALAYFISEEFETSQDWVFKVWIENALGVELDAKYDNDHSARIEASYSWLVNYDNLTYTDGKYIKARLYEEATRDNAQPFTITSLTNSGGFCRYVVDSAIDLYIGRKIDVEIDSGGSATFEGIQYVTQIINSTTFITDRAWGDSLGSDTSVYLYIPGILTEEICWEIDEECARFEYPLYWLNKKGGYEQFTLTGKAVKTNNVERVGKIKYNLLPDSFGPPNRQLANLFNNSSRTIKLSDKEYDEDVHEWLTSDLMETPDLYLLVGANLIPLNILNDSMVILSDGAKVNIVEFECEYAFERVTQSR